jgi:hypothetical protein
MDWQTAILTGVKKPCNHKICTFNLYKKEWTSDLYYSNNALKEMASYFGKKYGGSKIKNRKYKRWIAECPICGAHWSIGTNKLKVIKFIKKMEKKYKEIDIFDSISYGRRV